MEVTKPAASLISQINADEEAKAPREEVKLENLGMRIQPTVERTSEVSLGESGVMGANKSKYHNHYWRLFLVSFFIIFVTGIASIVLRLYSRYIYFASQPVPDVAFQTYVNIYKQ